MEDVRSPPELYIPESKSTVKVAIINTTSRMGKFPGAAFIDPIIPGTEEMHCVSFAFLIEHPTKAAMQVGCIIEVEKDVATILRENGQDLASVGGIVWSHWHFDHVGDPNTFPQSTDIIVGSGFKSHHLPVFPTVPESRVDERAWIGRALNKIDFRKEGQGLKIGKFDAIDLYGDGSFYLLDTPGHGFGHISGLARTTVDPPTFIFMGGDVAHHGGQFRPNKYVPLPGEIDPNPLEHALTQPPAKCPVEMFLSIHPKKSRTLPFFNPTAAEGRRHLSASEATHSIEKMIEFDVYDNIFPVISHDNSLISVVDLYPRPANDWQKKGWKDISRWGFLREFIPGISQGG